MIFARALIVDRLKRAKDNAKYIHSPFTKLLLRSGVRAIITWALRVSLGETLRAGHIRSYFDSELFCWRVETAMSSRRLSVGKRTRATILAAK